MPPGLDHGWLTAAVEAALDIVMPDGERRQVGLVIAGDEVVRELNRDYRGLDEVTDVLSFSPSHAGQWEGDEEPPQPEGNGRVEDDPPLFVYPSDEPEPLGEVVVSFPQARRQAAQKGWPIDREVALLIVHGVLHLAGYDHLDARTESDMQARERAALRLIPEVYPRGTAAG
jgi:probable rRNA maturation factor